MAEMEVVKARPCRLAAHTTDLQRMSASSPDNGPAAHARARKQHLSGCMPCPCGLIFALFTIMLFVHKLHVALIWLSKSRCYILADILCLIHIIPTAVGLLAAHLTHARLQQLP